MGIGEIRDALSVQYNGFYTMEPYDKSCNRSFAVKQPVDIKSTCFFHARRTWNAMSCSIKLSSVIVTHITSYMQVPSNDSSLLKRPISFTDRDIPLATWASENFTMSAHQSTLFRRNASHLDGMRAIWYLHVTILLVTSHINLFSRDSRFLRIDKRDCWCR